MQPRRESHGALVARPVIAKPGRDRHSSTTSTTEVRPAPHTLSPDAPVADETTALLAKQAADGDDEHVLVQTWQQAMVLLLKSAAPMVVGFLLEAMLSLSATAIAGRRGHIALGVVGNGNQLMGVTGYLVGLSACSAQLTLSAPVFTSKTNVKTDLGIIAQRSYLLANIASIPIIAIWWNIEPIMLALGQPPSLARGLREYMRWGMIALPGYTLFENAKAFLQAQGIFHAATVVVGLVLPVHIGICYFLVHHTFLKANGAAVAIAIANWMVGLGLCLYIWRSRARQCWGGFDRRCMNSWSSFLAIMVPNIFMYGSEWWSFELVSLFAGRLGETAVAAQAAVTNIDLFLAMIPYAGSSASLALLGNIIGHGRAGIRSAVIMVRMVFTMLIGMAVVLAIAMVAGRGLLAKVFTSDPATVELIKEVVIPMATYQLWDALQSAGGSILRAIARQRLAAWLHGVAYYLVAHPLGFALSFYGPRWGLVGLWSGQSLGLFLVGGAEALYYLFKLDWTREMDAAEERRSEENL